MLLVRPSAGLAERVETVLDLHLDSAPRIRPEPAAEGRMSRRAFTGSLGTIIYYATTWTRPGWPSWRAFGPAELIASTAAYLSLIRRLLRESAHAYLAVQRGKVLTDTGFPRAAIDVLEAGMRK